ncbi:hypothetical protein RN001_001086 [Aquatica leii]|uniref:Nuclease HARBI1 n=1 Tax=Aquatica leii TaxID=1421715 RepID=A0AAN7PB12_9COLE|nr:hypothetical protein RN001_001086 [Aquatica leii]
MIINAELIDEIEDLVELHNLNIERQMLPDNSNPFDLPNAFFKKLFRFEKEIMLQIITIMSPFMRNSRYSNAIPIHMKILTAISLFATGSYQTSIGQDFNLGLSQAMVSRAIKEVFNVSNQLFSNRYIRFPTNFDLNNIKRR